MVELAFEFLDLPAAKLSVNVRCLAVQSSSDGLRVDGHGAVAIAHQNRLLTGFHDELVPPGKARPIALANRALKFKWFGDGR